jgi:hypothetical protein
MPGWYVSKLDSRVEVKTYCECGRNCSVAWAVYKNDEVFESSYHWTRASATADAESRINQGSE